MKNNHDEISKFRQTVTDFHVLLTKKKVAQIFNFEGTDKNMSGHH